MKVEEISKESRTWYRVKTPYGSEEYLKTKKEVDDFIQKDSEGDKELAKKYEYWHEHVEAKQAKMHITVYPVKDSGPTDIEKILKGALLDSGYIEGNDFECQYPEYGYRLDFAFIKERIDIETDGEYWHPDDNPKDKNRDATLRKMGWKVLRFTGNRIKRDLSGVMQEIIDNVNERGSKS